MIWLTFLLMAKQTNNQFELKSVDQNSNNFKINGIDLSLVPDGIKIKKSMIFLCGLLGLLRIKI